MSDQTTKSEASRLRILDAASKSFRTGGFGGTGVDGLAKGANLTSGAFYFHFRSKLDAFVAALRYALDDLVQTIQGLQQEHGMKWPSAWIDYYLGYKRTCTLADGCSFPALTPEVERAGDEAKDTYEQELVKLISVVAAGLPGRRGKAARERSIVMLAVMSGGVNMSRAVRSPELSQEIAGAVRRAAMNIAKADWQPKGERSALNEPNDHSRA